MRRTLRALGIVIGVLTMALVVAWLAGVRVFVVQPIGALPDGATVILTGSPGLHFVDSPDSVCQRIQGGVSLLCRGMVLAAVVEKGTIIVRLPYIQALYWLSGAPAVDR